MKLPTTESRRAWRAIIGALAVICGPPLPAANRTWDGGGANDSWTNGANWNGRLLAPDPGDDLFFPAGASRMSNNNNFAARTDFNALTFSASGYNIAGNLVRLSAGVNVTHGTGNTILNLPLELGANQTFTVSQAGASLFLFGAVSLGIRTLTIDGAGQTIFSGSMTDTFSSGRVTKSGTGTLYILSTPAYGGTTTVNGGIVRVDGTLTNSRVIVNSGGTLRGVGTVAGITANAGGTVSPGFNTTDALNSDGDLILNAGSTLSIRLNGTSPELNYDQIDVTGTVTLGGTLNVTAGFAVPVGTVFTLIDNDGLDQISGTFAGLPEGAEFMLNGRPFRISYGARFGGGLGGGGRDNDVTLEAIPALCIWDGGGGLNRLWSTPQNWLNDITPIAGDDIQFAEDSVGGNPDNNFPAGSRFGSIIFAGGGVTLGGNSVFLEGAIRDTGADGNGVIRFPLTIGGGINITATWRDLAEDVVLAASQTFSTGRSLGVSGNLDLGSHRLTLNAAATTNGVGLSGIVSGAGGITKEGPGSLRANDVQCTGAVIINEGRFYLQDPATVSGLVEVNAGGFLDAYQPLGEQATHFAAIEVRGGRLRIGEPTFVSGPLSLLDGASFEYMWTGGATIGANKITTGGPVTINGCSFLFSADTTISTGQVMSVILTSGSAMPIGTFDGLGEGGQFMLGSRRMGITYAGGDGNDIQVIADPPPIPWTWDGGGAGSQWMTAGNWNPDAVPPPGSALVFPDGVSDRIMGNNYPAGTVFHSLTFERDSYILGGNALGVSETVANSFASGPTLIPVPLTLTDPDGVSITLSNASELRLSGAVSGRMVKTGTGLLSLSGSDANELSGDVLEGTVLLGKSSGNSLTGPLVIGNGVVRLGADHQMADDAEVAVTGAGRLELNGFTETIGSLGGDGAVVLGAGFGPPGRLTLGSGNFAGNIGGPGGVTKSLPGTLTLSGTSAFLGTTIVNGGTLAISGSVSCLGGSITDTAVVNVSGVLSSPVPLQLQGGTLTGRGTVPAINATGGILGPGQPPAGYRMMMRSGAVTLNAATTFRALITGPDPDYETQKLSVTGSVSLGASSLSLHRNFAPLPGPGKVFLIIENDGSDAVVGAFAGLPQGAQFDLIGMRWQISYSAGDGNDVTITFVELVPPLITGFTIQPGTGIHAGKDVITIDAVGIPQINHLMQYSSDMVNWTNGPGDIPPGSSSSLHFQIPMPAGTRRSFLRVLRP